MNTECSSQRWPSFFLKRGSYQTIKLAAFGILDILINYKRNKLLNTLFLSKNKSYSINLSYTGEEIHNTCLATQWIYYKIQNVISQKHGQFYPKIKNPIG